MAYSLSRESCTMKSKRHIRAIHPSPICDAWAVSRFCCRSFSTIIALIVSVFIFAHYPVLSQIFAKRVTFTSERSAPRLPKRFLSLSHIESCGKTRHLLRCIGVGASDGPVEIHRRRRNCTDGSVLSMRLLVIGSQAFTRRLPNAAFATSGLCVANYTKTAAPKSSATK